MNIDKGSNPNQVLAAVWLSDVLRDARKTVILARSQREIDDLVVRLDDAIKQFDEIMGPEVRTFTNELKLLNPFGAGMQLS